ncbi:MAG: M48 family metallopeptidase [Flavobacteriaceae bacterium]|jgi:hypothetical protein|nr:M48 family metallopeptidase [Flavobacteriaceae bacterium]
MKLLKLLFILYSSFIFSQKYIPIDTIDKEKRDAAVSTFQQSNKIYVESLKKNYPGKDGKLLVKSNEEFSKEFEEEIKEGKFCYDPRFLSYIEQVLNGLRKNNPLIPSNSKIMVSKDPSLNAYCLPNGTFVFNMGLFYWLENDDQLVSVLSHELSHKILNHSEKSELAIAKEELSTKTKVRSLKKQKYKKHQAAFSLFKSRLYATGELRKKHEYQADSLGLVLMKNASLNEGAFIDALQLMEKYDTIKPVGLKSEIYKKIFNLPNQPFKKEWLEMEDFSKYDYSLYEEKINKDSTTSHPKTDYRIVRLKNDFPELKKSFKKSLPTEEFKKLQEIAEYEQVPSMYFNEQYGEGIYLCLIRLQESPSDKYYLEWLGKCFEKIYEGRKNYQLNRYLDHLEPKEQSESYQQFLNFMWNLSLEEIGNIVAHYTKKSAG